MPDPVVHVVSGHTGETVAVLVRRLLAVSHRRAKALVTGGAVRIDGTVATDPACRPAEGARVEVDPGGARTRRRGLTGPGFRSVHLDADVIVVEKAPGVVTIPTGAGEDEHDLPLVARVATALKRSGHRARALWVVHRIDRETSGLVVLARTEAAAEGLRAQFRARRVERSYLAWCARTPEPAAGTLVDRLDEAPHGGAVRVTNDALAGREARLAYEVVAASPRGARVRVVLESGRRNQIRVQFASRGWPLLGDTWYGAGEDPPGRTALHAARLAFAHPRHGRPVEIESSPPADLLALDRALFRDPSLRVEGA